MTKKKDTYTSVAVSPEDETQAQQLLAQLHQIAQKLQISSSREQAETALADITSTTEASQMALLKALSKEYAVEAADVLLAINELSPNKIVRKEARRSLIRLEAAKVYPQWNPPIAPIPGGQATSFPPRFWKGVVTEMREKGDIELILCWEQGFDYSEVRVLIFRLDFWHAGVKNFIIDLGSKRYVDAEIAKISTRLPDITTTDCTLAEGRRLLQDALSVNTWRGIEPHKDYRHHLPTVKQLVLEATDIGEDRGRTFIDPKLDPEEVVLNYVGGWSMGDYALAYDLFASTSDLHEELSRDEWIERHRSWFDEASPARLQMSFVREREAQQPAIWLPSSLPGSRLGGRKEVELGWSLELAETQLSGTLTDMPMGTAVNTETRRHWFWTSYTLVREQDAWRIKNVADEGINAQGLAITELQERAEKEREAIDALLEQEPQRRVARDTSAFMKEYAWRLGHILYYYDALISKLPLDRTIYERAAGLASLANQERALVYLERMAQRFSEGRLVTLRHIGAIQADLSDTYNHQQMYARGTRFFELAEASLREAASIENTALDNILLAELFLSQNKSLDEAEAFLQQAQTLSPITKEQVSIESDLGHLAFQRQKYEEALHHYHRALEIDPTLELLWYNIGSAQRQLERFDEAIVSLERAVAFQSSDIRSYMELATIYLLTQQLPKAYEVVEQGLQHNPESAHLVAILALISLESGNRRQAQKFLEEAERLDPTIPLIQVVHQELEARKK